MLSVGVPPHGGRDCDMIVLIDLRASAVAWLASCARWSGLGRRGRLEGGAGALLSEEPKRPLHHARWDAELRHERPLDAREISPSPLRRTWAGPDRLEPDRRGSAILPRDHGYRGLRR